MAIIIRIPLPCPLNSLYMPVVPIGKRYAALATSKQGTKKWKEIVIEVQRQLGTEIEPITAPVGIVAHVYPRDKRIPDVDAYMKQMLDVLQVRGGKKKEKKGAGIYENDTQVKSLLSVMHTPLHPGHIELHIYSLTNEGQYAWQAAMNDAMDEVERVWIDEGGPRVIKEEVDPDYEPDF